MFKKSIYSILICLSVNSMAAESFTLRGDAWCPFNCDPVSDGKKGYMVEIAEKIFTPKGISVDYKVLNWNRTKKEVTSGSIDAAVGASKSDGDFHYSDKSLGMFANRFYVLKDQAWVYKNLESLKGVKVGVINDYTYGEVADKTIASRNPSIIMVSGDNALPNLVKMLELKRLTAIYENPAVFAHKLKVLGKDPSLFKEAGTFDPGEDPLYIGFSKKFAKGKEYSKLLSEGIAKLRKSGELKAILDQYGLKDWEK